ncbi:hypothetical protein ACHAQA_007422 [Verticillium albo-atrum]
MTSPTQPTILISNTSPLETHLITHALSTGARVRLTHPSPALHAAFPEASSAGKLTSAAATPLDPSAYRAALDGVTSVLHPAAGPDPNGEPATSDALALLDAVLRYGTFVRTVVYAAPSGGAADEGWGPARAEGVLERWVEERSAGVVKVPFGVVCVSLDAEGDDGKGMESVARRAVEAC